MASLSDYIKIKPPNRFHKYYRASTRSDHLADIRGKTRNDAIENLFRIIEKVFLYEGRHAYRTASDGTVFCLYYAYDSWCYDIVHGSEHSSCHLSAKTYTEALAQMEQHVAQYGK